MKLEEENSIKNLEMLFKKAEISKSKDDLAEFKLILDDYLDQGYNVKKYIFIYNSLIQKLDN
ncbi:MAG TPA: hypothetical protein PK357_03275 [Candidatus Pacearchaeota archaeon]|nr:hypothetical protein [Candidatus Pacearchaeota archaeon]